MVKLRKKGFKSLKKHCCDVVNENVRVLVVKNHKSKKTLLEEGIVDIKDINTNPLLLSSTTNFDTSFDDITKTVMPVNSRNISVPSAIHEINSSYRYNDNYKLYNHKNHTQTYESLPFDDFPSQYQYTKAKPTMPHSYIPSNPQRKYNTNDSNSTFTNPFADTYKMTSKDNLMLAEPTQELRRKQPPIEDPFNDEATIGFNDSFDHSHTQRNFSNSSLTYTGYNPSGITEKQLSKASLYYQNPVTNVDETKPVPHANTGNVPYPFRGVSMYGPDIEKQDNFNDRLLKDYDKSDNESSSSETGYPIESLSSIDDDKELAYSRHN